VVAGFLIDLYVYLTYFKQTVFTAVLYRIARNWLYRLGLCPFRPRRVSV